MRNKLFLAVCAGAVLLLAGSVYWIERGLKTADVAYFQTAPVDPRALMMGDYMTLGYDFERTAPEGKDAALYIGSDQKVSAEGPGKKITVKYHADRFKIPHQFYFKEGDGDRYARAKYVKMRVLPDGRLLALELTDENLNVL